VGLLELERFRRRGGLSLASLPRRFRCRGGLSLASLLTRFLELIFPLELRLRLLELLRFPSSFLELDRLCRGRRRLLSLSGDPLELLSGIAIRNISLVEVNQAM